MPLVLLFSDGHHNAGGNPEEVAQRIKSLNIDGDPVIIACAGVDTDGSDQPDERLLQAIASPECYVRVRNTRMLSDFSCRGGKLRVLEDAGSCRRHSRFVGASFVIRLSISATDGIGSREQ